MANPFTLPADAGTTIPIIVTCTRLDGTIPNLSGASAWATFKNSLADADPGVLQKTMNIPGGAGGITIYDPPTNSKLQVLVAPGDLPALTGQVFTAVYQVDVKVKEANGNEWVVAKGTLTINQTSTRAT